ncbi:D-alanyl-D-alanine carboxypeptidase [Kribbella pratensis]|uniref:D-alanyl-D-alanine carboxypeptidase n=1 Tax=Kribbella pratensis TaxID=2512112 RepID=A0ABY2FKI3_9ACTN|nr:serine hydrolase domain-containing protein [Kribbella pratensis]TDW93443.1 D-alanyl-D-alanine carboxypeptidase [Kribbella pratensis]
MSDASSHPQQGARPSYRRTAGVLAAGALAVTAITAGTASTAGAQTSSADITASAPHEWSLQRDLRRDVEAYLTKYGANEHASAVGLSVSLPGRSNIDVTAGTMSFDSRRPVPGDAVWQIGSNTKAFTSVILLQLEAEHRLSIDDPLGKWLPQYPQWRHVTLRSLLNMTSGIRTYDETPEMLSAYAADPNRYFSQAELVSYAAATPPAANPWTYSNTGYILTEMIIEKVTGNSYSHELYSRIINRLQLKDTFYRPHAYPRSVTAREPAGYFHVHGFGPLEPFYDTDVSRYTMSWTRAAGGIFATLHDMTVWERAMYSGQMLPAKQQAELLSLVSVATGKPIDTTSAKDPAGFGLGVQQSTTSRLGTFWNYQGGTLGVRTLHVYLPESKVIMAMGVNSYPEQNAINDLAFAVHATLKAHGLIK